MYTYDLYISIIPVHVEVINKVQSENLPTFSETSLLRTHTYLCSTTCTNSFSHTHIYTAHISERKRERNRNTALTVMVGIAVTSEYTRIGGTLLFSSGPG